MSVKNELKNRVLNISSEDFEPLALDIFRFQAEHNAVYRQYISCLKIDISKINKLEKIPFMPIGFFKNHKIVTLENEISDFTIFESSGTTGNQTSRHYVSDLSFYENISTKIFEQQYESLQNCHFLALLPSYLERQNSSLVYMIQHFIEQSNANLSGFFLNNVEELLEKLKIYAQNPDQRTLVLWGVTFALLDFAEGNYDLSFLKKIPKFIVMETGGMKGRRQELLRQEVHKTLCKAFGVKVIHSEYGMTELLSQAYSVGNGIFTPSATLRILLRDPNDPFAVYNAQNCPFRYGGINVIDLANVDSCAFIETQDLGTFASPQGHFEVIGRFDNSDVRGCNLMI